MVVVGVSRTLGQPGVSPISTPILTQKKGHHFDPRKGHHFDPQKDPHLRGTLKFNPEKVPILTLERVTIWGVPSNLTQKHTPFWPPFEGHPRI